MPLHMIAYTSENTVPANKLDECIEAIVKTAKRENPKHGITGALFFHDNRFLQVIEGKEEELRQLMANIENDERHNAIEYLVDMKVESRGFHDWNMDSFQLGQGKSFDLLSLQTITECFKVNLLPHSQTLIYTYKALLKEQQAA